ncbi:MAG TPA: class I SAM-dependent methyltransferase [Ktedonobacterales bacterium]|nr:class I SAM-dependent methyltransferase [Ktedonobacterales bacterium]
MADQPDDYIEANRGVWDAWTVAHTASDHHADVAAVRAGGLSLRGIERAELGDVAGKRVLHLQCNMGADTLSLARLGAAVTGVDISNAAITHARQLADETGLPARFVRSDVYALPDALDERFDIVFTSYGALCWLGDLDRWASIVARSVKPGGIAYLVEMHPFSNMLAAAELDPPGATFRIAAPYFTPAAPLAEDVGATTRDPAHATVYAWSHGLGEILSALLGAGLRLDYVHEFPYTFYRRFPELVQRDDGYWHWPDATNTLPLLFSVRATR